MDELELKERVTLTLDPDVLEWLRRTAGYNKFAGRENDNASALANSILRRELEKELKKQPATTAA